MAMTRGQLMDLARDIADAFDTGRWPDTKVRRWLGVEHDRAWKEILNANNAYQVALVTVTEDASGRFLKTALDTGAGDLVQRHYRILSLSDAQQFFYRQSRYQDYPSVAQPTQLPYVWYELGAQIQMLPAVAGNIITAEVNYAPTRADMLVDDNSFVPFVDGHEELLAYKTAAHLATKGAIETTSASQYAAIGDQMLEELLKDIRRAGKDPLRFRALDDAMDYASF